MPALPQFGCPTVIGIVLSTSLLALLLQTEALQNAARLWPVCRRTVQVGCASTCMVPARQCWRVVDRGVRHLVAPPASVPEQLPFQNDAGLT